MTSIWSGVAALACAVGLGMPLAEAAARLGVRDTSV